MHTYLSVLFILLTYLLRSPTFLLAWLIGSPTYLLNYILGLLDHLLGYGLKFLCDILFLALALRVLGDGAPPNLLAWLQAFLCQFMLC